MERRQFGSYVLFTYEPENEIDKREYISTGVKRVMDKLTDAGIIPIWNTIQVIVKEGIDLLPMAGWDEVEEEEYEPVAPVWQMCVAVKFYSENYPVSDEQ